MDAIKWWREARFGMFIHWGIYSALEGYYNGKETPGIGEWIQKREEIPIEEYKKFADKLTLEKFDAVEYAQLAEEAGMKYITLTAKHHDGFAMYDSHYDPYNIVNMSPSGRDPSKELVDAARGAGLTPCFYYSQAHDWADPNAAGNDWDFDEEKKDFSLYLEGKCKHQLHELLTQYGDLGLIWFDVPSKITEEQSRDLKAYVKSLQPNCLVSGRISSTPGIGDYGSLGDNQAPAGKVKGDWETCATLNGTWGYKRDDHNWKNAEEIIKLLVQLVSKGMNLLLNIGPKADGEIPIESVKILKEIGQWMKIHSDSIYGTTESSFATDFEWGYSSTKGNSIFLYVFDYNTDIKINGIKSKIKNVELLGSKKDLKFEITSDSMLSIKLDADELKFPVSVVRVDFYEKPQVESQVLQLGNENIRIPSYLANITNASDIKASENYDNVSQGAEAYNLKQEEKTSISAAGIITNWFSTSSKVKWTFKVLKPGKFQVELRTLSKKYSPWVGGHSVTVELAGQKISAVLREDTLGVGPNRRYFFETGSIIGSVNLPTAGEYELVLTADHINEEDTVGLCISEILLNKQPIL